MTAYLDVCQAIPDDRKSITLVYFDARELSFDDIGIAPRMLDAIRDAYRSDGLTTMETLSDILIWLARRGFNIRLCVDANVRRRQEAVNSFLRTLSMANSDGNLTLYERNVIDSDGVQRSMHKKTLITPIYILGGSANLTYSGTTGSEELDYHVPFGEDSYLDLCMSCQDTLSASQEFTL